MEQFIESVDGGVSIALNANGDRITVLNGQPLVIDEVSGAKVKLSAWPTKVSCETFTPETAQSFRWNFELKQDRSFNRPEKSSNTLEAIVGELRVALNGKL